MAMQQYSDSDLVLQTGSSPHEGTSQRGVPFELRLLVRVQLLFDQTLRVFHFSSPRSNLTHRQIIPTTRIETVNKHIEIQRLTLPATHDGQRAEVLVMRCMMRVRDSVNGVSNLVRTRHGRALTSAYLATIHHTPLLAVCPPALHECRIYLIFSPTTHRTFLSSNYNKPNSYGAAVAERLARSPPTKANRAQSPAGSPDPRKWEPCRAMSLVGGSSRGSPVYSSRSLRCCSIFTSTTHIGSEDLAVKNSRNLFTEPNSYKDRKWLALISLNEGQADAQAVERGHLGALEEMSTAEGTTRELSSRRRQGDGGGRNESTREAEKKEARRGGRELGAD
ncbi:hypothetical protein PR048_030168 [Dryococelus australis]|uniref:Uncharacterized protein n=1 Tax=Dryococelus australis TaxID=614101 RepID=A0ABQ9G859_9NEOP|nr:hypothetical protein PR048_030168 [Dryococelus australis]